jgi:hypothetical protein
VTEASLWERFHWRPSELDEEDIGRILTGIDLLDLYRDLRKDPHDLSPEANERVGKALQLELENG